MKLSIYSANVSFNSFKKVWCGTVSVYRGKHIVTGFVIEEKTKTAAITDMAKALKLAEQYVKDDEPAKPVLINIVAKEWTDKTHGNAYFSARIYVDHDEQVIYLPFQYGYGEHFLTVAGNELAKLEIIDGKTPLYSMPNITLVYSKEVNCLKRDVKSWGKDNG